MARIYLDHAATTPLAPGVREAMEPWSGPEFGNPSSLYEEGRRAKEAIDRARETVSETLGCLFGEVLFTGSGTEAANMAIIGTALANQDSRRNRILMGAAEHHCVLHTAPTLQRLGCSVELIPVDRFAQVSVDALSSMIDDDVLLVAVMQANNELGTLNPIENLIDIANRSGSLFFCDAVQTLGTVTLDLGRLDADMMSFSAHKIGGPKGTGALFLRSGVKIKPLLIGGGQEREMRAGTENVAGIVGFGAALLAPVTAEKKRAARTAFLAKLSELRDDWIATVPAELETLPGHAHIRFPGIHAESMLIVLDRLGLAASSGAACSSGSLEPSHVMLACGYDAVEAAEGLRFTFGRGNTIAEAQQAAERVSAAADQIRSAAR